MIGAARKGNDMSKVSKSESGIQQAIEQSPINGATMPVDAPQITQNSHTEATPSEPKKRPRLNLAALQNAVVQEVGVEEITLDIKDRKPPSQSFIRVHPSPSYQAVTYLLVLKEKRGARYILNPDLLSSFMDEVKTYTFYLAVTTDDIPFLWPVRHPDSSMEKDSWAISERAAVDAARKGWVRIRPNMQAGQYTCVVAPDLDHDPVWPHDDMETLLDLSFVDRYIEERDHPVLLKLRGKGV